MRISSYAIMSDRLPSGGRVLMNGISGALDIIPDESLGDQLNLAIQNKDTPAFFKFAGGFYT